MNELIHKAAVLLEALPYIQRFSGERFVVGAGKDLAYKRSSDNWKVWARS